MEIDVTPELNEMIRKLIADGTFSSPEDAVRGGLARLTLDREPEELSAEESGWLKKQIAVGMEDVSAGRVEEWDVEAMWREICFEETDDARKAG